MSRSRRSSKVKVELYEPDLSRLQSHAGAVYPEECCGILLGRFDGATTRVTTVLEAENGAADSRRSGYEIAPQEVLAAARKSRALGEEIVGYYHSHPDAEAEPSDLDTRDAWPGLSYLIVPVARGVAGQPRSWRLEGDSFCEQPVGPGGRPEEERSGV